MAMCFCRWNAIQFAMKCAIDIRFTLFCKCILKVFIKFCKCQPKLAMHISNLYANRKQHLIMQVSRKHISNNINNKRISKLGQKFIENIFGLAHRKKRSAIERYWTNLEDDVERTIESVFCVQHKHDAQKYHLIGNVWLLNFDIDGKFAF